MKWLTRLLSLVVLAGMLLAADQASAGEYISVGLRFGPPPVRREFVHVRPGFVWIRGHWGWLPRYHRYAWLGGYWIPARRGHVWVDGCWVHGHRGWVYNEGYWRR